MSNQSAFPFEIKDEDGIFDTGMTLRDYFAAAALSGMLARGDYPVRMAAVDAYEYASEMMKLKYALTEGKYEVG